MGVSGAGKSLVGARFAEAMGIDFVEGDTLHPAENVARMAAGVPLTDGDRAGWLRDIAVRLADARQRGEGMVVSCSALKRRYRDILRTGDPDVTFVYLAGGRELVSQRLAQRRGHFMPPALLDSQFAALEPPGADERAWSVDVDATPDEIVAALVARARAESRPRTLPP
jgi:gluconokinase